MADLTGLMEKIARWFEPKPTWTERNMPWESAAYLSDRGVWYGESESTDPDEIIITKPNPIDFLHDEAANARLRDAMLSRLSVDEWIKRLRSELQTLTNRDIGQQYRKANVLAFAKWAGIPVEEEL